MVNSEWFHLLSQGRQEKGTCSRDCDGGGELEINNPSSGLGVMTANGHWFEILHSKPTRTF